MCMPLLSHRMAASSSRPLLRVFDTCEGSYSVAFAPSGHQLLPGGVGTAAIWDIRDLIAKPRMISSAQGYEIQWDLGTLQFSQTARGPWTDLPAASPFKLSPIDGKGFFRLKVED